ncbi:UNVERIFIED_CONTAM: protein NODULATION SIGNALING PATHWAY 1 [Sesamum latifolium]|uniref:Protein NODULATION SIGNALING PATHWAY 1 n=1 Tax=Sesamum latifolium TaxID=2727402 RepID=A0AAW2UI62_9LAMI
MTIGEPEPNPPSDHVVGWMGESVSYFPTFFDDPYETGDFSGDSWWVDGHNLEQDLVNTGANSFTTNTTSITPVPTDSVVSNHSTPVDSPKKRKLPDDSSPKAAQKNKNRRVNESDPGPAGAAQGVAPRKPTAYKKVSKSAGNSNNNSNNKEGRWAEQLNPCAITGICPESSTSSAPGSSFSSASGKTFASSSPKFFRDTLIKFNDINPWFRIPNNVANTSILQILAGHWSVTWNSALSQASSARSHHQAQTHSTQDDRTAFLRVLRSLQPKGVILSENNTECSCSNCGDFATGFSRRVEYLWRFLDSTSVAFKGRESEERRMMEAEAAKVLINVGGDEMKERGVKE